MIHLSIDLETYSSVNIKKSGLYRYVQSPDFQIMLFAYSFNDKPVQIVDLAQGETIPEGIVNYLYSPEILKHAYNAPFEWYCLSKHFRGHFNHEYLPLEQWRCTMMHALYCGYPAGLAATGAALGLTQDKRKLGTGMSLIRTFCIPCKPTKTNGHRTRTYPHHEPEKWELFKEYCKQDVVTEMEVARKFAPYPVPEQEQHLWELDQRINVRGVEVDQELVGSALQCSETVTAELTEEAVQLSGVDNPKSVAQLTKWLADEGEEVENLQKATVKALIKSTENDTVKRMLEIRQELGKTSVRKYAAMQEAVGDDGRVRGLLQFYGANRTGRWAGRLVQVQNLPRNYLGTLKLARSCTKNRKLDHLKIIYGNVPDTLSQLIRTAFIPRPGCVFVVADFSAIEARVIAWLAGEQWRLDVFATHGMIYEASASAMFGVPIELISKGKPEYALRQKGKIAELALGYQGAAGALITMGALNMGLTEDELPEIVHRWRQANRRIVDLWYAMENAALQVMRTGGPIGLKGLIIDQIGNVATNTHFLTIQLPSGRKLYYAQPFLCVNEKDREALHYWGTNQTSKKWEPISTYGGKLVENVVQAIARDCLAESLVRLEAAGYQTVMHIHDEVVLEVAQDCAEQDLERACAIMGYPISWAPGLPLKADGFISEFYKKE
jgi:DNA polymerase